MTSFKTIDEHLALKLKKIAQAKYKNEINDAIVATLERCEAAAERGEVSVIIPVYDVFGVDQPEIVIAKAVSDELNQCGFVVDYIYNPITVTSKSALQVSWLEA